MQNVSAGLGNGPAIRWNHTKRTPCICALTELPK